MKRNATQRVPDGKRKVLHAVIRSHDTPKSIMEETRFSSATVQKFLKELCDEGLLEKRGAAPHVSYKAVDDLSLPTQERLTFPIGEEPDRMRL